MIKIRTKLTIFNDGNRNYKLHQAHVIPQPSNEDQTGISKLLEGLGPLSSKLSAIVLITKVLTSNDTCRMRVEFEEAIAWEIVVLLNKKPSR